MDTKTKWRFALMPFALAGLAAPAMQGCGDDLAGDLCCTDFNVGADLSGVDFGGGVTFSAFIATSADFAASATAMITDVGNACKAIAVDLKATPEQQKAITATEPAAAAKAWCDLAVAQIQAEVTAKGSISVNFQPPQCTVNVEAQGKCEASCSAKAECEITPAQIIARCEGPELSGKCEAMCSGSCEGSANLAVNCTGSCSGTCEGKCDGMVDPNGAVGECKGTCEGKCRGSCKASAGAMVQCDGECKGGCSVEYKAPKCTGKLKPPEANCTAEANCSGSCEASASAKAECKEPSLTIVATGSIDATAIASLKANLPKLLAVFKGRGQAFIDNAKAVVEIGADATASADLSVKAVACGAAAVRAIGDAVVNAEGSVSAAGSVMASAKIQ